MKQITIDFHEYERELKNAYLDGKESQRNTILDFFRTLFVKCDRNDAAIMLVEIYGNDAKLIAMHLDLDISEAFK